VHGPWQAGAAGLQDEERGGVCPLLQLVGREGREALPEATLKSNVSLRACMQCMA
jgi:hypothetical protein